MKQILFMILVFVSTLLMACSGGDGTYEYPQTYEDTSLTEEVIIPEEVQIDDEPAEDSSALIDFAAPFFARLQYVWDKDNGDMWGEPLHSAVVVFCMASGMVAANRADAEGELTQVDEHGTIFYVGARRIWRDIVSHGFWNDERAVFLCLNDQLDFMYQDFARIVYTHDVSVGLVNHYIIHWKQAHGILPQGLGQSPGGSYSTLNNITYMVEINALINAILSEDDFERVGHVHNALSIRYFRRTNSQMESLGARENAQIIAEGIPTYTEMVLPLSDEELAYSITLWPEFILWRGRNISLSYAYFGGALYGILLDILGIGWRPYVSDDIDLGELLIEHLGITYFIPYDEMDLEQYGYSEISYKLENTPYTNL